MREVTRGAGRDARARQRILIGATHNSKARRSARDREEACNATPTRGYASVFDELFVRRSRKSEATEIISPFYARCRAPRDAWRNDNRPSCKARYPAARNKVPLCTPHCYLLNATEAV